MPEVRASWANIALPATFAGTIATVVWLCVLTVPRSGTVTASSCPAAFLYLYPLRLLLFGLLALSALNLFQRYWMRITLIAFGVLALGIAACLIGIAVAPSILHIAVESPAQTAIAPTGTWVPLIPNVTLRIALAIVVVKMLYPGAISLFRAVRQPIPVL